MDNVSRILVELSLQNQEYLKRITESQKQTEKFASSMSSMSKKIEGMFTTGAIIGALKYVINKAEEVDEANRRLGLTLKSTGGIAGVSAGNIKQYAEELSKTSVNSRAALTDMSNELLRYTNIHQNEFKSAMQSTMDLASGMRIDLASAANIVGKALQNPANAARALRAAHITLSAAQQQQINNFMKLGDVASAQEIVLKKFQSLYGGQAASEANDFGGAIKRLQNNFAALGATAGQQLMPGMESLLKSVNALLQSEGGVTLFTSAVTAALTPLRLLIKYTTDALEDIEKAYKWAQNKLGGGGESKTAQNLLNQALKTTGSAAPAGGGYEMPTMKGGGGKGYDWDKELNNYLRRSKDVDAELLAENKKYNELITRMAYNRVNELEAIENAHASKVLEIQSRKTVKYIELATQQVQKVGELLQTINQLEEQDSQRKIAHYENMKTFASAYFQWQTEQQMIAAGVQEQTQEQKNAKDINSLQKQIAKEHNLKKRKDLQTQLRERQNEQKRLQIQQQAQIQQQQMELMMELFEMQMKRRQFERNKQYQLANVWINTAAAITAAWLAAWTMGFPPLAIAMGAIATALLLANAIAQTVIISRQQAPMFATGTNYVMESGLAMIHRGEEIKPAKGSGPYQEPVEQQPILHIEFSGPVYGIDDFKRKVIEIVKSIKWQNGAYVSV